MLGAIVLPPFAALCSEHGSDDGVGRVGGLGFGSI